MQSANEGSSSLYELRYSRDRRLARVYVSGKDQGSVRLFDKGWSPIGAFVGGLQTPYFRSAEDAAATLVAAVLQRLVSRKAEAEAAQPTQ